MGYGAGTLAIAVWPSNGFGIQDLIPAVLEQALYLYRYDHILDAEKSNI